MVFAGDDPILYNSLAKQPCGARHGQDLRDPIHAMDPMTIHPWLPPTSALPNRSGSHPAGGRKSVGLVTNIFLASRRQEIFDVKYL
jgi:hypothetical protein